MFEAARARFSEALLAIFFALAPSAVPEWRGDPRIRVAVVLAVGEPTPSLAVRPGRGTDAGG